MFIQQNNVVRPAVFTAHYEELPPQIYVVGFDQFTGFYLTIREGFSMPPKIYGDASVFPARILDTYSKMGDRGMSVLLSGPKGTGKTVDAKMTCNASNLPIILIDTGFGGAQFGAFIDQIKTPCIFFIDEFEKVYAEEEHRNFFLSIMDGVSKSRHLFILTSNQEDIGQYFKSRPGRVRYHQRYEHLNDDVIKEVIADKLEDPSKIEAVTEYVMNMSEISMDSLTCMIDECNMHNEVPKDFMKFFNIEDAVQNIYNVTVTTVAAYPRAGLVGEELEAANNNARYYNEYFHGEDEDNEDYDIDPELCELKETKYTADWAEPFSHYDVNMICHVRAFDKKYRARDFYIRRNEVKEFTKNRKGFSIRSSKKLTIVGTPAKKYAKFAF